LGAAATDQLAKGNFGVLVGMKGNDVVATPLSEIAGKTKPVDQSLLELAQILAR
jgi:6-phosphofructokinase 1